MSTCIVFLWIEIFQIIFVCIYLHERLVECELCNFKPAQWRRLPMLHHFAGGQRPVSHSSKVGPLGSATGGRFLYFFTLPDKANESRASNQPTLWLRDDYYTMCARWLASGLKCVNKEGHMRYDRVIKLDIASCRYHNRKKASGPRPLCWMCSQEMAIINHSARHQARTAPLKSQLTHFYHYVINIIHIW
jgi:hypothetical protein